MAARRAARRAHGRHGSHREEDEIVEAPLPRLVDAVAARVDRVEAGKEERDEGVEGKGEPDEHGPALVEHVVIHVDRRALVQAAKREVELRLRAIHQAVVFALALDLRHACHLRVAQHVVAIGHQPLRRAPGAVRVIRRHVSRRVSPIV
jgi:hypothetical protein